ncbi:hypothetical protein HLV38_06845 [Berryella wangjianweii]|uniref:Uncharacterized protein n=1 Tax=Berryella wangjianweii TaxID=2734634 RepID=A0A6M8J5G0_9ACTN|nr:hypothetical protein [Berryella wangjianweii]QKF07853.1 hypothetical protein HLV38_06845 [Berryella wangjianweii]
MGFTVVGPEPGKERTTWAERRGQFDIESFERVLGNRVEEARNHASNMEEFREELKMRGVELTETRKADKESGEETVGWSYKARDPYGKSKRKRRRRASNLADDLTKEGVEAYFEQKQRQAEVQAEAAQTQPEPAIEPEVVVEEPTHQEREDSSADSSFGTYFVTKSDVAQVAGDLQRAHIGCSRDQGKPFAGERYDRLMEAECHPDEQLARLRAEVDAARADFHASKRQVEELRRSKCPTLLQGAWLLAKTGCDARDPVSRMMADMTAMMLREMIRQFMQEQLERQREEAERRLYESRANMWDAEKRLKAAEKAVGDEDERERRERTSRFAKRAEQKLDTVAKRQAEDDAQYQ